MKNIEENVLEYFIITESALDLMLVQRQFNEESGMPSPVPSKGFFKKELKNGVEIYATSFEPEDPYVALIKFSAFEKLGENSNLYWQDLYARIARVVKGLRSPPIHLPRPWSEFHYKNRIAFFATPKTSGNYRWIADTDNSHRCVRFSEVTRWGEQDLAQIELSSWPDPWEVLKEFLVELKVKETALVSHDSLIEEVDLQAIGAGSIVKNRTFEAWQNHLAPEQLHVISQPAQQSVRIIGPAGSGKTLALCLRAIAIARNEETSTQAKKILIVTHSWAMAERIDGIISMLASGIIPSSITILPLLDILKEHGGYSGRGNINIIGDDSKNGRIATLEIIKDVIASENKVLKERKGISDWISSALNAPHDSRLRAELALNLYEEFTGVLAASGIALDDADSIKRYLADSREDWMPPFGIINDRKLVLAVYHHFLRVLVDRGAITTDQFVLDAIRTLETFSWRMRRETDGYDYIFADELQLFDSQERLALALLGRANKGVPFCTSEDPSQGVFSALHSRRANSGVDDSIYLDSVHRFNTKIFEFIKFIYQKFPLNTIPLKIDPNRTDVSNQPVVYLCNDDKDIVPCVLEHVQRLYGNMTNNGNGRISIVTLGDVDDLLSTALEEQKIPFVQLRSFDDVEQLSYSKRAVVVSPWEFIGGTQFSHVIVVAAETNQPTTSFGKLRALTAIYLACSRAAVSLDIVCGVHVPSLIQEAIDSGFVSEKAHEKG